MDQFLISEVYDAMNIDSKVSSHPIVQNVSSPDEITALFDSITYEKVRKLNSENNFPNYNLECDFFTGSVHHSNARKFRWNSNFRNWHYGVSQQIHVPKCGNCEFVRHSARIREFRNRRRRCYEHLDATNGFPCGQC